MSANVSPLASLRVATPTPVRLAACVVLLSVTACAGAERIAVFAPAGSRQCEPAEPGQTAQAAVARLGAAGVAGSAARCGHDGRMRAALCGLPDGRIVVVDVPADSLDAARAAGWKPLAEAPDAAETACR